MKRKPRVKFESIKRLGVAGSVSPALERIYMGVKRQRMGYKLFEIKFVIERKHHKGMTPALDEMHAMQEATVHLTEKHQERYKMNRYGCPK